MTEEELAAIPRRRAAEILASIPATDVYSLGRLLLAIETEMHAEWCRGYYAGKKANPLISFSEGDHATT